MGSMSIWHWVVVALVVILLFGRGKISDMMGDVAKGIKAFKKGIAEEQPQQAATQPGAPQSVAEAAAASTAQPSVAATPPAQPRA